MPTTLPKNNTCVVILPLGASFTVQSLITKLPPIAETMSPSSVCLILPLEISLFLANATVSATESSAKLPVFVNTV